VFSVHRRCRGRILGIRGRAARKGSDEARRGFHRYSLLVWFVWLVPYFGGMYLGMQNR
jgi:hypothetical protein